MKTSFIVENIMSKLHKNLIFSFPEVVERNKMVSISCLDLDQVPQEHQGIAQIPSNLGVIAMQC